MNLKKQKTAVSLYRILHMWFRSNGIHSVYSLVCPHSLGTDACFASHGNMISTHGTKSCPHLLNIQTERCSYHHLQLSVKILKYCTLTTMKRPELIDIKVFFLIKPLSEKPFRPPCYSFCLTSLCSCGL